MSAPIPAREGGVFLSVYSASAPLILPLSKLFRNVLFALFCLRAWSGGKGPSPKGGFIIVTVLASGFWPVFTRRIIFLPRAPTSTCSSDARDGMPKEFRLWLKADAHMTSVSSAQAALLSALRLARTRVSRPDKAVRSGRREVFSPRLRRGSTTRDAWPVKNQQSLSLLRSHRQMSFQAEPPSQRRALHVP